MLGVQETCAPAAATPQGLETEPLKGESSQTQLMHRHCKATIQTALLIAYVVSAQTVSEQRPQGQKTPASSPPPSEAAPQQRTQLNLKNETDTTSGESRRNDNVAFNPIDNNTLRDLSLRLGFAATIVTSFAPQNRYFSSEYGSRPELPIHVDDPIIRAFHGEVFETHSNSVLSARSFFQAGGVKPAHENSFGFRVGGILGRGLSFTLQGDQQRSRGSVNGNVLVPAATERTPLTKDPRIVPMVERLLAAYPAQTPNRPDIDSRALNTNSPQRIDTDRATGTVQKALGTNDRLALRYGFTQQRVQSFEFVAGQNPDSLVKAHAARISWESKRSSQTTLFASAGFDRIRTSLEPEPHAVGPAVSIFIIQGLGSATVPLERAVNDFQEAFQVRHSEGGHSITAGFNLLRRQFSGRESSNHLGTFAFTDAFGNDAVTNLRLGLPSSYSITVGGTARGYRNWTPAFYAGDVWRATTSLTLNFGLRYEPVTAPAEVNRLDKVPFGCDCNNVAPTFGVAYRLPREWGTIRSAYGMFYGQLFPATYGQQRFNPPGNVGITVTQPDLVSPLAGLNLAQLNPNTRSSLTSIASDLVVPYSHQYNFSWETAAFGALRMQLGYVGSRTPKLYTYWSMNRAKPVPGIAQTLATINDRRPDPSHFMIYRVGNGSRAYYDAARVSAILRPSRGFSLDVSYWFSKAIDDNGDFSTTGFGSIPPPQAGDLTRQDFRGHSNFDQPHAFLMRASYATPDWRNGPALLRRVMRGWTVSAVQLVKSGTPFTVFAGSDAPGFGNVDGESGDRVNVVDPSVLGRVVGNPDTSTERLPRSAFAFMNPTDLRGNIGRNTFRKGGIRNVNAALAGSWKAYKESTITVRAESVNLFNTPQFADPERNLSSKLFGRISNTLNSGRSFLFTLKFSF